MQKRNFILLIIIFTAVLIAVFVFLYFRQTPTPGTQTEGINFGSIFSPFGDNSKPATSTTTPPPANISGYQPEPISENVLKLKKVSSMPVAGFVVFNKERLKDVPISPPPTPGETPSVVVKPVPPPTEFMTALRYVERTTGNIYQTFADKIEERRFSTTIIPKVHDAFFGKKGEVVIMRYLKTNGKTIETFVGNLPKEILGEDTTENNEIKGNFLPEDTTEVALSPDTGSLFYLFKNGENIIGATLNLSTNKKSQIFDSSFTEWLPSWPNNKTITFTTKPSYHVPGYIYAIDPNNKNYNFYQIFGGINGLTTLPSPNGKLILYGNDNLTLGLYHRDTKTSTSVGVKTLPEKCVWGKGSDIIYCAVPRFIDPLQYPDAWYQGEVSFTDQIWKIDVKTGNTSLLVDPISAGEVEEVDGIKLALDDSENYLFFINKKDSFLWELSLK